MLDRTLMMAALFGLGMMGGALAQTAPAQTGTTAKGPAFVDPQGKTLYTFDKDSGGKSACSGPCAQNWPPFTATGGSAAGGWSVITRDDGAQQWAYKGKPLYTFARDTGPGQTNGDGFFNGAWHIAQP